MINQEQIFELQNRVLEQANMSYDRITNLLIATIGIFLSIAGVLAVLQYRMSDKQIQKLKMDIESEMKVKYSLDIIEKLQKDFQYTRLEKTLEDMSRNVSDKSYSLAVLIFGIALEYVDVSDENFVFTLLLGGHMDLISVVGLEDEDTISGFHGKSHNDLWDKRLEVLKKYELILEKIEKEGTNNTEIWTMTECKDQVAEKIIELHKKKKT